MCEKTYSIKVCPKCNKIYYDSRNMNLGRGTDTNYCSKCGKALIWKTITEKQTCWNHKHDAFKYFK